MKYFSISMHCLIHIVINELQEFTCTHVALDEVVAYAIDTHENVL